MIPTSTTNSAAVLSFTVLLQGAYLRTHTGHFIAGISVKTHFTVIHQTELKWTKKHKAGPAGLNYGDAQFQNTRNCGRDTTRYNILHDMS